MTSDPRDDALRHDRQALLDAIESAVTKTPSQEPKHEEPGSAPTHASSAFAQYVLENSSSRFGESTSGSSCELSDKYGGLRRVVSGHVVNPYGIVPVFSPTEQEAAILNSAPDHDPLRPIEGRIEIILDYREQLNRQEIRAKEIRKEMELSIANQNGGTTGIACRYCIRRRIRCFGSDTNPEVCANCLRFHVDCVFDSI
ncbi:hypothetical protein HYFRA_00004336 [Hymenoscyphus fraxineus]|uniref:Zn(2)-C6 fungal-type domain-containing protein n=1 Tax=Hymenoscyphus fraxineus TaxID=746836 RepID=A0A9N9PNT6_9HELO|nr:hypothetical protein HYFRA_00004336 [Hymenoscyphus fraxineus]